MSIMAKQSPISATAELLFFLLGLLITHVIGFVFEAIALTSHLVTLPFQRAFRGLLGRQRNAWCVNNRPAVYYIIEY